MRVLEEEVESWKQDHDEAMRVLDAEDLIAESLSRWKDARRLWERARMLASRNELEDIEETGKALLDMLNRAISLFGTIAERAELVARHTGHAVEGQEKIPEALRDATGLRDHLVKTWPWDDRPVLPLNRQMIEESRASRERGESLDVADILSILRQGSYPR